MSAIILGVKLTASRSQLCFLGEHTTFDSTLEHVKDFAYMHGLVVQNKINLGAVKLTP